MTSNSDFHPQSPASLLTDSERFELLSAYLDGETTAAERQQVQQWLDTDPEVQRLYRRLLALRQMMQAMPEPAAERSPEELVAGVFATVERRQRRRHLAWGGSAIAALVVGAVALVLPGDLGFSPRFASRPSQDLGQPLAIALNEPVVAIPNLPASPGALGAVAGESLIFDEEGL